MKERVSEHIERVFRPEFLNRLDDVIIFRHLTTDDLKEVIDLELAQVRERLGERGFDLRLTDDAKEFLIKEGCKSLDYGARPLRRAIENRVEDPLSEELLRGEFQGKDEIVVDVVWDSNHEKIMQLEVRGTCRRHRPRNRSVPPPPSDRTPRNADSEGARLPTQQPASTRRPLSYFVLCKPLDSVGRLWLIVGAFPQERSRRLVTGVENAICVTCLSTTLDAARKAAAQAQVCATTTQRQPESFSMRDGGAPPTQSQTREDHGSRTTGHGERPVAASGGRVDQRLGRRGRGRRDRRWVTSRSSPGGRWSGCSRVCRVARRCCPTSIRSAC